MQCDKLQFSPKKGKFSSSAHSTSTPCFFKEDETGEREDSQQFDHDDDGDDDDDDDDDDDGDDDDYPLAKKTRQENAQYAK